MFWKKKKKEEPASQVVLGMVLLHDAQPFNLNNVIQDLRTNYNSKIGETTGDEGVVVFDVDGQMVALSFMPMPVPQGDIDSVAHYAYNWQTAIEDLKDHKGHIIVSILRGDGGPVQRFTVFTQVICALLRTTNAIGVYKGSQSLLIPKDDYLERTASLQEDSIPLDMWIYMGIRSVDGKNSAYTYGLKLLGKTEMEIVNSTSSIGEIGGFLMSIADYVVENDVEFKDGETCGFSAEQRIKITYSKGQFVEGKTFKLAY